MDFRKRKISRDSPRPPKPMAKALPKRLILCLSMSEFLCFADFRSLVRSVWPDYNESDVIRARLWELSTYTAEVPFFNGKRLSIEFNHDPWREIQDCILINIETLTPIFGRIMPPAVEKFSSVSKIENFVRMHVHLNMCSDYRYRSCPCHLKNCNPNEARAFAKPSVEGCKFGNFHHYCSQHISHWLKFFLNPWLIAREEKRAPSLDTVQSYLYFSSTAISF